MKVEHYRIEFFEGTEIPEFGDQRRNFEKKMKRNSSGPGYLITGSVTICQDWIQDASKYTASEGVA